MIVNAIPYGRTARRLEWAHLPPAIRAVIERSLGSPVVEAQSQRGGYTPGFASVLTTANGERTFVKAASSVAQRLSANGYREEARKLRTLPPAAPAPRLLWVHDADDWVVLGIQYVEGRPPHRPWTGEDLAAASTMLVEAAEVLTPAPGMGLDTFAAAFADMPAAWDRVRQSSLNRPHADEAAELAARFHEVTAGDTLVHGDVRDDNIIITSDGSAVLCDWNWPTVGAAWIDSLVLLIGPWGDGSDVNMHIATHPLLAQVPSESIDIVLALLAGYFLDAASGPAIPSSPYLRAIAREQGEDVWNWLSERRGW